MIQASIFVNVPYPPSVIEVTFKQVDGLFSTCFARKQLGINDKIHPVGKAMKAVPTLLELVVPSSPLSWIWKSTSVCVEPIEVLLFLLGQKNNQDKENTVLIGFSLSLMSLLSNISAQARKGYAESV